MNQQIKSITFGAITAGIGVLAVFSLSITAGITMPFLSIPLIIYGLYFDLKQCVTTSFVMTLLVGIVFGSVPYLVMMATYNIVALAYIYAHQNNYSLKKKFMFVVSANAFNYLILMTFFGAIFGLDFQTTVHEVVTILGIQEGPVTTTIAACVIAVTIILESCIVLMGTNLVVTRLQKRTQ